ncbi:DUF983 domain-containing protein [Dinghuibacter silviterrae]|uniref:DUF983 domain-containing protein n=1 Tax=Dinghuibacter silviterrae TaxID=1539049 RepID=A0A4R8DPV7_9BACT|nr:DUF983 domain-containing protein [Dinghuibacter silviterrae]TDX00170.1 hypothetical protein EDB95_1187 [Dinghuibacter silviterrae]
MSTQEPRPNYLWSMLNMRCPRCRRGRLFKDYSAYNLKHTTDMNEECPVCKQPTELEPGFYYGTGYVSYALSVALIVAWFVAWWVLIGFSSEDNRIFWCLGSCIGFLFLLQPWLMRLSRTVYLWFFVRYDPHYREHPVKKYG